MLKTCWFYKLTGAIFVDLSKAFDLVDHYLLLDKLYSAGLSGSALLWFNSYLHNRKQCVVTQGSCYGPVALPFTSDSAHLFTDLIFVHP